MKFILSTFFLLLGLVSAQFQFFEQFFQGGQQQQGAQQKQNVPSDSNWYRQNWEAGEFPSSISLKFTLQPFRGFQVIFPPFPRFCPPTRIADTHRGQC